LIDLGVNQAQSGIFGAKTEHALKALQADLNLPQTGVLDAGYVEGSRRSHDEGFSGGSSGGP
jgi:peptidoglycan hydrolase-like protein with peptidoglycan-binding domain